MKKKVIFNIFIYIFIVFLLSCKNSGFVERVEGSLPDGNQDYFLLFVVENNCSACQVLLPLIGKYAYKNYSIPVVIALIDKDSLNSNSKINILGNLKNVYFYFASKKDVVEIKAFPALFMVKKKKVIKELYGLFDIKSFFLKSGFKSITNKDFSDLSNKFLVFLKTDCDRCEYFLSNFLMQVQDNLMVKKNFVFLICSGDNIGKHHIIQALESNNISFQTVKEEDCFFLWDVYSFPCVLYYDGNNIVNYGNIEAEKFISLIMEGK